MFDDLNLHYIEQSGLGFLVKQITADEINEILKCYALVPIVRRELIEKSRNEDCTLYIMLETDDVNGGWHFGYKYPNDIGIYPFTKTKLTFKDVYGG